MSEKRIAFICNGCLDLSEKMKVRIEAFPFLVAVDGGAEHCRKLGLKPNFIIGDLDSCSLQLLSFFSEVPLEKFPQDKGETDLELALSTFMRPDVKEITVFGALGKHIDHTLNNILLLSRFPGRVFIESARERIFIIDKQIGFLCLPGQTLSLIPLNGPVAGVETQGLKWELTHAVLDRNFIGISNETIAGYVRISVGQGDLLCCLHLE